MAAPARRSVGRSASPTAFLPACRAMCVRIRVYSGGRSTHTVTPTGPSAGWSLREGDRPPTLYADAYPSAIVTLSELPPTHTSAHTQSNTRTLLPESNLARSRALPRRPSRAAFHILALFCDSAEFNAPGSLIRVKTKAKGGRTSGRTPSSPKHAIASSVSSFPHSRCSLAACCSSGTQHAQVGPSFLPLFLLSFLPSLDFISSPPTLTPTTSSSSLPSRVGTETPSSLGASERSWREEGKEGGGRRAALALAHSLSQHFSTLERAGGRASGVLPGHPRPIQTARPHRRCDTLFRLLMPNSEVGAHALSTHY